MNTNLFERILVPTEMSAFGDLALRYALQFAERLGTAEPERKTRKELR